MKEISCAYCGRTVTKGEKEQLFPRNLYPASKGKSNVQRLTIPSCSECNRGWSSDEAHFRNVLALAGEPNAARRELWETKVDRSFDEVDGLHRLRDLLTRLEPVEVNGEPRQKIYPARDERVLRIVRKAVRGLSHHHCILSPVPDEQVWVDVLKYVVPAEFLNEMEYYHREPDVAEYRYKVLNEDGINSAWLITFFEVVTFIGIVRMPGSNWPDPSSRS